MDLSKSIKFAMTLLSQTASPITKPNPFDPQKITNTMRNASFGLFTVIGSAFDNFSAVQRISPECLALSLYDRRLSAANPNICLYEDKETSLRIPT